MLEGEGKGVVCPERDGLFDADKERARTDRESVGDKEGVIVPAG